MMHSYSAIFLSLVASALAYQVTSPNAQEGWTSAGPNTVSWQRVDTDPSNFTLVLTNEDRNVLPSNNQVLIALVDGTTGSTTVPPPSNGFPVGGTFRLNFVKDAQDLNSILAQSSEFNITKSTTSSSGTSTATGTTGGTSSRSGSTMTISNGASGTSGATGAGGLNPTTSDTTTSPTSSSAALPGAGVTTGFLGLVALVGAFMA
ncbi:hypothetical protein GLOTRDRAFT_70135 [Gloeophyllum trabeum ATCC 11539]|uniref:Yeast cell wall synthesis Kre9/Knh1-like N-terminal domain-containing protein n=1 Tax=Gloeophyllum trabeum (strain ATCC 11539 / FP-39264 / Madison 617) TaxID=670483 RepID=S7S011_GLOTA|nr:uncharacterized protein GLOTRDRAFT_70135 [Gloeophyllum trabeum ATCC 11539]EPQ59019.1 hypothetical protein GLOTRDRAFT_70135 [Gloeophyllum trabeum ATCC 11539]